MGFHMEVGRGRSCKSKDGNLERRKQWPESIVRMLRPTLQGNWRRPSLAQLGMVCAAMAASSVGVHAQSSLSNFGDLRLLRADGSDSLHSQAIQLTLPQQTQMPVELKFGFETDEIFGPGQIFDAFTLTMQSADGILTAILVTVDASGVVFAPEGVGPQSLPDTSISHTEIPSPSLTPHLAKQVSFSVQAILPDSWSGKNATLYLDLFDNNNGILSQGWMSDLVVVPEPALWPLVPLAGLVLLRRRSRK